MQQRVAIARALAYEPEILLMDEPFASVDAQTRADLEDLILEVRREYGVTVVFVTHDIDESVYLSDRVVVLTPSPTRVQETLDVDLPSPRDQLETKELPEFAKLRGHVYRSIKRRESKPDPDPQPDRRAGRDRGRRTPRRLAARARPRAKPLPAPPRGRPGPRTARPRWRTFRRCRSRSWSPTSRTTRPTAPTSRFRSRTTSSCTRPAAPPASRCACSTPPRTGPGGARCSPARSRRRAWAPPTAPRSRSRSGPHVHFWAAKEGLQELGAMAVPAGRDDLGRAPADHRRGAAPRR